MSTLSQLKLVATKKPLHQPAIVIRRNKLSSKLWEQIQLAKSQISGQAFTVMKFRSIKDTETGLRKQVNYPKESNLGGSCLTQAKSAFQCVMVRGRLSLPKANPVWKSLVLKIW